MEIINSIVVCVCVCVLYNNIIIKCFLQFTADHDRIGNDIESFFFFQ